MSIFLLAIWFGVVYGLISCAVLLALSYAEPPLTFTALAGVDAAIFRIGPLFTVLLFGVVALGIVGVGAIAPKVPAERLAWLAYFFLTFVGLLMLPARLHRVATLTLGAGLTLAAYRAIAPRLESATRFVRRSLPVVVALWLATAGGVTLANKLHESRQAAQLPPARTSTNVLLIVLDTLRADHMSVYGYARETTPRLDRLAREGTVFTQAIATSSWTLPSHASLFTGLHGFEHGAGRWRLRDEHATLAEALASRGYRTAGFVANTSLAHRRTGIAQGFQHYEDFHNNVLDSWARTGYGRRILPRLARALGYHDLLGRKRAAGVNDDFLKWLDGETDRQRPFFAFLNYFDVHDPYLPPAEYAAKFSASAERITRRVPLNVDFAKTGAGISAEQRQVEVDGYDASLAYLDAQLGKLFDALAARGLLDNTLVIVVSDHGEEFGEHGGFGHNKHLYRETLHVPLLLRLPGKVPAGRRDARPVDLTSVPATVLELAGVNAPMPGSSLLPFVAEPAVEGAAGRSALAELEPFWWLQPQSAPQQGMWRALVNSQWHFVQRPDGKNELYDWARDPAEKTNLAADPAQTEVVEKFLVALGSYKPRQVAKR